MEYRPVKIQNSLLTEGKSYVFRLLGKLELGRGEPFLVMLDPFGYKMLVPAGFYADYGLKEGQKVVCKIDKISCSGKMYLEPQHPHYEEGKYYDFEVISLGCRNNLIGSKEWCYRVRDIFGLEWIVKRNPPEEETSGWPEKIQCLVVRIKKGQLFLRLPAFSDQESYLKQGETYSFKIVDQKNDSGDGFSYFILQDERGSRHLLRKKHYYHYGLKPGQQVICRVDGVYEDGLLFLEPLHPVYETGKEYVFDVARLEEYVFSNDTRQKVVVLRDVFGEEIKKQVAEEGAMRWVPFQKLLCRVNRIRKSRVEVDILEGV
ncbi:MAG: hypothetical protein V2I46_04155 [Bacteroides sp.]|jgi:hypothetical protein|nr:hypothetical protein [Bacteroides sp.]